MRMVGELCFSGDSLCSGGGGGQQGSDSRPPSASCSPCEDPGSWGTSPQLQGDSQPPTTPSHQHLAPHEVLWSPGQLWSVVRRVVEGQAGLATPASAQDRAGCGWAAWQVHSPCANPAPACLPPEVSPDKPPPGSQGSRSQPGCASPPEWSQAGAALSGLTSLPGECGCCVGAPCLLWL